MYNRFEYEILPGYSNHCIGGFHQKCEFCNRWRYKVPPLGGALLAYYFFKTLSAYQAAVPRHLGKKFQVFQATSGESTAEIF